MNETQNELLTKIQRTFAIVGELLEEQPFDSHELWKLDTFQVEMDSRYDLLRHRAIKIDYRWIMGRPVTETESKRFQRAAVKLEAAGLIERIAPFRSRRPSHFKLTDAGQSYELKGSAQVAGGGG